jgi:toxin-antitoxin system PIN domain toxin
VILIDANLLLHAYSPRSTHHEASRQWLEKVLEGPEHVRLSWLTVWAFMRIASNPRVFEIPLSAAEIEAIVSSWLEQPHAGIVEPGERHWEILTRLVRDGQASGPLVMDAVLAAIAIEHGAVLYTSDRDFSRFDGLEWRNPLTTA